MILRPTKISSLIVNDSYLLQAILIGNIYYSFRSWAGTGDVLHGNRGYEEHGGLSYKYESKVEIIWGQWEGVENSSVSVVSSVDSRGETKVLLMKWNPWNNSIMPTLVEKSSKISRLLWVPGTQVNGSFSFDLLCRKSAVATCPRDTPATWRNRTKDTVSYRPLVGTCDRPRSAHYKLIC